MASQFKTLTPAANLSDQLANALSVEIRAKRMVAGDRLPTEATLATQFGVSRTVVREAVSRLKSLGVLDSRQGSGVFVREAGFTPLNFDARLAQSLQAVIQMAEVRRTLEGEAAALAARRRTPEDLARIRAAVLTLRRAVRAHGDGVEQDINFHQAIARAAQNPFLISTLDYLRQFLRGATGVTRANEARRADFTQQVEEEHEAICQAIEAGDALKARRAAVRHMDNAIRRIERADPGFWQQEGVQLAGSLLRGGVATEAG